MNERDLIRIGNQTAFSARFPTEPFEYAVAKGFNAFEWFPDRNEDGAGWDENNLNARKRRYIRDVARAHDIAMSVHVPLDVNPLRSKKFERLFSTMEFADDIGATLLNIHLFTEEGIEIYVDAIAQLFKRLSEIGIKLAIENTPLTGPGEFNKLFGVIRNRNDLPTNHVGMCIDLGHANLHDKTRNNYLEFMDELDSQVPIVHVHLHENYGDTDSHMTLFSGPSSGKIEGIRSFLERLIERKFSGAIILEQWPYPSSLLDEARNRLYSMLASLMMKSGGVNETI